MNEQVLDNLETWRQYWGSGFTQYLLLAAILYLLIRGKKIKQIYLLCGYFLLGMFFFWFPLTAKMIHVCIGEKVYWRYIWILPVVSYIAYAFADLCNISKNGFINFILAVLTVLVLLQSGTMIWETGTFVKYQNPQKVPQVVADLCDLIKEDAQGGEMKLVSNDEVAAFARVYDPNIIMPYGREGRGNQTQEDIEIYRMLTYGPLDARKLLAYMEGVNGRYLVIPDNYNQTQLRYLERHGFARKEQIDNYILFVRNF